jgi:excinuclease ABC subunit B
MWGGDRARKTNLVEYGFRLPSAMDNRPLSFSEFEKLVNQVIFVSATPADYELEASGGVIIEQIIRPTGLIDPQIEVRPSTNQIRDILEEINQVVKKGDRVLITTLTKRMAEELTAYLVQANISCRYIHSEVKTLDRVTILNELRDGKFDVLVGVNLLREGLDLPQVSLMLILDADKEGFLRNARSLIQTIGRVARHAEGRVIMYADRITASMEQAISETHRRRTLQMDYNLKYHITPSSVHKQTTTMGLQSGISNASKRSNYYVNHKEDLTTIAADVTTPYGKNKKETIHERIKILENQMYQAAAELRFLEADRLKETIDALRKGYGS